MSKQLLAAGRRVVAASERAKPESRQEGRERSSSHMIDLFLHDSGASEQEPFVLRFRDLTSYQSGVKLNHTGADSMLSLTFVISKTEKVLILF